MYNMELWNISGHAANYRENMFLFEVCGCSMVRCSSQGHP